MMEEDIKKTSHISYKEYQKKLQKILMKGL